MKYLTSRFAVVILVLVFGSMVAAAQDNVTVAADSDAAQHLDLYAVAELFKDSETIEKFEQTLNGSETGINNLDLNNDGHIDFIRVSEQSADATHFIVLQAALAEDDWQDVATIAAENEGGKINLHFHGSETIYGADYYVVPANSNFSLWNIVRRLYSPSYRAYVSPYRYNSYPRWWTARRPIAANIYRTRAGKFVSRKNFVASRTVTVKTVNKINYRPRVSTTISRRTNNRTITTVTKSSSPKDKTKKTVIKTTTRRKKN